MGEKIVVGIPIDKGFKNNRTAFVIDNDSFPAFVNAYQWRGRAKRKRGTSTLGRLTRFFNSTNVSYTPGGSVPYTLILDGSGKANLFTGIYTNIDIPPKTFSLQINGNLVPGSVVILDITTGNRYTDPGMDGILVGAPAGSGTVNYATGDITISGGAGHAISITILYYPDLPVMGLEDLTLTSTQFPESLDFDTTYSYRILSSFPYSIYDVSFYKNPDTGTYPGYTRKTFSTPTTWNGQDYQQFWTVNYQGALWATNGINIPFDPTNVGMQYLPIQTIVAFIPGPPGVAQLQFATPHGLSVGDFLFINEVNYNPTTGAGINGINFQTGFIPLGGILSPTNINVVFPNATLSGTGYTGGGIAQFLTNRSNTTKDCLRWYDGDPTDGNPTTPTLNGTQGWVNFAPPLSRQIFSIADLPEAQYYLVGARMIVPFKDRLLFLGPVIQTSAANSQIYLQDTVIYSQNGTPYYTASFTGDPSLATTVFTPIIVPDNQTATPTAYWEDQTGFGGFVSAGISQAISTVSTNEDVLLIGLDTTQSKLVYSGNDVVPFNFYLINSELGSSSTFSVINMDKGCLTRGSRGYIVTSQVEASRLDLDIPDQVFQINLTDHGEERFCANRDYINEWVYFTYPSNQFKSKFPSQTLQYNYRDNSWAIFNESYTTYGSFRKKTGLTWGTVGTVYPTWGSWNVPWGAGSSTLLNPEVIAGNQQGFVLVRDDGTDEGNSLYIRSFSSSVVTSPDHGLNNGDYIIISGCIGTVGQQVNGKIFSILYVDKDNFILNPGITASTYSGGGLIKRMYVPYIQTKQFPVSWGMGRKTRLGVQQYLLSTTDNSQIQLLIFLSQNSATPYNTGNIIPQVSVDNNSLIYSTVLYTCPESTNLGLTPANINLQMPTAIAQDQIWHRINTSLLGDTVQLGFTLSDSQMRSLDITSDSFAITAATQANPCVLNCVGKFAPGQLIQITGVTGMTQLNFDALKNNYYNVLSSSSTQVTIEVDSTGFDSYISGGSAVSVSPLNQFAEIELHGFILEVSPSQMLA